MPAKKTAYADLFLRNFGVFTRDEQERLRTSRVLIVGCGGIGGVVAESLARTGVEGFILVEFDSYEPSNMNRQIACFSDTLGRNKASVLKKEILRINPAASVRTFPRLLSHDEIFELIKESDLVFPAADDLAFSMIIFREAQGLGKPSLLVLPAGTWANVCIITPDGSPVERLQGSPTVSTYEELRGVLAEPRYRVWTYFFLTIAGWRPGYYRDYWEGRKPLAQICPLVWTASSLGAMEAVKVLSGKWKPVALPRYWEITQNSVRKRHVYAPSVGTLRRLTRIIGWHLYQTRIAGIMERCVNFFMNSLINFLMAREKGKD